VYSLDEYAGKIHVLRKKTGKRIKASPPTGNIRRRRHGSGGGELPYGFALLPSNPMLSGIR